MKRFGAACLFALAVMFLTAGCNDYGNTFQANTGAGLISISPSIINAGSPAFTITAFGSGFVTGTVIQWNGHTITTTPNLDPNNNIVSLSATVTASLVAKTGTASVNTLSPHSGSMNNGLSNSITFIINPPPNPLPVLTSMTPTSIGAGSTNISLTLSGGTSAPNGGAFLTDSTVCQQLSPPVAEQSQVIWIAGTTQTTLATTSVTATQIVASIPNSLLAAQGTASVSVYNPPACPPAAPSGVSDPFSGGGGTSATSLVFTIDNSPPTAGIRTGEFAAAEETPALGLDGRYVAYTATQNGRAQIFLRDTCAGAAASCQAATSLLSAAADGSAGNADSNTPSISTDGRFAAFSSAATNLVASAPAGRQIYLRDTCAGAAAACVPQTTLLSIDESGALAGNDNLLPSVSSSGRFVAFLSVTSSKYAAKQPAAPNSGYRQVFVRDTCFGATSACTPKTIRISLAPGDTTSIQGKPAGPAISGSAKSVGVASDAVPTLFTHTIPVDDRVFLAITDQAPK